MYASSTCFWITSFFFTIVFVQTFILSLGLSSSTIHSFFMIFLFLKPLNDLLLLFIIKHTFLSLKKTPQDLTSTHDHLCPLMLLILQLHPTADSPTSHALSCLCFSLHSIFFCLPLLNAYQSFKTSSGVMFSVRPSACPAWTQAALAPAGHSCLFSPRTLCAYHHYSVSHVVF